MGNRTKIALGLAAAALLVAGCDRGGSTRRSPSRSWRTCRSRRRASGSISRRRRSPTRPSVTNPLFPVSQQAVGAAARRGRRRAVPDRGHAAARDAGSSSGTASRSRRSSRSTSPTSTAASTRSRSTSTPRPTTARSGTSARTSSTSRTASIADTDGTWLAGKDGPAAMIMPADPQVGDVYRPENIPGFVFEEVTVKAVDQTLDGPARPGRGRARDRGAPHGRRAPRTRPSPPATASSSPAAAATSRRSPSRCRPTRSPGRRRPELDDARGRRGRRLRRGRGRGLGRGAATVEEHDRRLGDRAGGRGAEPARAAMTRRARGARRGGRRRRSTPRPARPRSTSRSWSLDLQLRHRPATEIDLARFDLWAASSWSTRRPAMRPR